LPTYSLTPFQLFIAIGCSISFLFYFSFQIFYFIKYKRNKSPRTTQHNKSVSIIICSKNQAEQLKENLPFFLNQNYPNFEIILVNDCSTDNTEEIIRVLQSKHSNLKTTNIPIDEKFNHNKKLALTIGIKAAKNDQLIFSNPNCKPVNENWLTNTINSICENNYSGYSNFENKKGFLYNFMKYDLLMQSLKVSAFSSIRKTYAANGDNMGYSKTNFFSKKAFAGHSHFEAGYDHLALRKISSDSKVSSTLSYDTKTLISSTQAQVDWKKVNLNYYISRKFIPKGIRLLINLDFVSKVCLYLFLLAGLLFTNHYIFFTAISVVGLFISGYCFKIMTRDLKEANLFLSSYVYGLIRPFSKLLFYIKSLILSKRL